MKSSYQFLNFNNKNDIEKLFKLRIYIFFYYLYIVFFIIHEKIQINMLRLIKA